MYPCPPSRFEANPYQDDWFERDFMHTAHGIGEFPDHPCKQSFMTSRPFIAALDVAVDIGCGDGAYTRYLQHYFNHVYCFDPHLSAQSFPYNADLSRITHFQCALGEPPAAPDMSGGGHDPRQAPADQLPCYRLDDFGLGPVDYLRIDAAGSEHRVLEGGAQLIARYKPLVVVAQDKAMRLPGQPPRAAKTWLEQRGYHNVATCPRGRDHVMVHEDAPIPGADIRKALWRLIKVGAFYMPDSDIRFSKLGEEIADYQRPQRDAAFKFLKTRRRALDIGANIGIFSRHFAQEFDRVSAFEPLAINVACLERNLPGNVEIHRAAVGDAPGEVQLYQTPKTLGNAFISGHADVIEAQQKFFAKQRLETAPMITIDSLGLDDVDLIKLDIQGAELIALKGAVETIRRCRPVIMVEEKATGEAAEEIDRIRVLLQGLGMVRKDRVGADRIYVFA